jgi:hypothetical protein
MMRRHCAFGIGWRAGFGSLVFAMGLAGAAAAQTTQTETPPVSPGQEVWVTQKPRAVVHGSITAVSAEAIDVVTKGEIVRFPFATVTRIQVPGGRSTLKGALIGALAGGAIFAIATAVSTDACQSREGFHICLGGPAWTAVMGGLGGAIGAGAGAIVGSNVRKRVTVYPRDRARRPSLRVSPAPGLRGAALDGVIRW